MMLRQSHGGVRLGENVRSFVKNKHRYAKPLIDNGPASRGVITRLRLPNLKN
jgi:hypothetical protein